VVATIRLVLVLVAGCSAAATTAAQAAVTAYVDTQISWSGEAPRYDRHERKNQFETFDDGRKAITSTFDDHNGASNADLLAYVISESNKIPRIGVFAKAEVPTRTGVFSPIRSPPRRTTTSSSTSISPRAIPSCAN
jgi:hypothetical protein